MKSCSNFYNRAEDVADYADQIILKWINDLPALLERIADHPHQIQIMRLTAQDFDEAEQKLPRWLQIADDKLTGHIRLLLAETGFEFLAEGMGIPYFTEELIDTWDKLHKKMRDNACAFYLGGELGFNLPAVNKVVNNKKEIRVTPHLATSDINFDYLHSFWVRPEDLHYYDPYVQVFEVRDPIDFRTYFMKGEWKGNVWEFVKSDRYGEVIDFEDPIDNTYLSDTFGVSRIDCQKKCYKGVHCAKCEVQADLAQRLSRYGLVPIQYKDQEEVEDASDSTDK